MGSGKRTIRACVFDLGNTLINDSLLAGDSTERMARWLLERALIPSTEAFSTTFRRINFGTVKPFISHTFGETEFFQRTFDELAVTGITAEQALKTYREILMEGVLPDPEIADAFRFLRQKGIKLAILSNERQARVDAYLEKTGLTPLFDTVVVSETVGIEKPDLRIFREVLTRLDVGGEECAMFGDNPIADGAGKELGFLFVLVTAYLNREWVWEKGAPYRPDHRIGKIHPAAMAALLYREGTD